MIEAINKIEQFLKEDTNRAIDIHSENNQKILVKYNYQAVQNEGGVVSILTNISKKHQNLEAIIVILNTPNGSTGKTKNYKKKEAFRISFDRKASLVGGDQQAVNSAAPQNGVAPTVSQTKNTNMTHEPLDYGSQANSGMNAGLMGVHMKAFDYDRLTRELVKTEEKYKAELEKASEKHKKIEKKIELLISENIEQKTKIAVFNLQQELDKKLIEASVKKTDVGEVFEKLGTALSPFAGMMMKNGAIGQQAGMAGVEVSATKQSLIELVQDEGFTDKNAIDLYNIHNMMQENEVFKNALIQLIKSQTK